MFNETTLAVTLALFFCTIFGLALFGAHLRVKNRPQSKEDRAFELWEGLTLSEQYDLRKTFTEKFPDWWLYSSIIHKPFQKYILEKKGGAK